ncbi:MAG: hypothetical protein FJW98_04195 [Actinobacteria bacterium]|nr:hypothetical protein [Actinomycetota bacterium]
MNTSTRKKILTVAGALAVAGALVIGVATNGADKNDSTAVEQVAEFEAMLEDGVIDQGTLQSFLSDIIDENSPITSAIKDVMSDAAVVSEPKVDAKVTVKDDAPAPANKPVESAPADAQVAAPASAEPAQQPAQQPAAAVNERAGAATTPEASQPVQESQPAVTTDTVAQQPASGSGTTSTMPQWLLDMAKSTNVNILDVYKSWQSNGGTFSGITNPSLPTQPSAPTSNEICRRLGTC